VAYDRDVLGLWLRRRGTVPVLPGRSNRLKSVRYSKKHYRQRNVIERMFCRLKGFRRQAIYAAPETTRPSFPSCDK